MAGSGEVETDGESPDKMNEERTALDRLHVKALRNHGRLGWWPSMSPEGGDAPEKEYPNGHMDPSPLGGGGGGGTSPTGLTTGGQGGAHFGEGGGDRELGHRQEHGGWRSSAGKIRHSDESSRSGVRKKETAKKLRSELDEKGSRWNRGAREADHSREIKSRHAPTQYKSLMTRDRTSRNKDRTNQSV